MALSSSAVVPTSMGSTTATAAEQHVVLQQKPLPTETFRLDYKPPQYYIKHADLHFDLGFHSTKVNSTLTMYRSSKSASCDLQLDGVELTLLEVSIDGAKANLKADSDGQLRVPAALLPAQSDVHFKVNTIVEIHPEKNLALMGLFKSGPLLVTQCEAEGFRRITYFLDRPDVMATFHVRLSADKSEFPVLISNGNRVSAVAEGMRHHAEFDDPFPKPAYLFAVVAGQLEALTDTYQHPNKPDGKKVSLSIWAEGGQVDKLEWAMESLKKAMQWDEDVFGLEYDLSVFSIVCVRDFNMGAMENKSLNVFVSSLILASPHTSTDFDYQYILGVVGHEYFHNWTGDRVTCRDWFQLTLKEGLTVFRDQQFSGDMCGSHVVKRIQDVERVRASQFAEDAGPMAHPIRPDSYIAMDNFYTATVYRKGAEIIRMYHTILGQSGFRAGMDLYFKRHDGQAVTCDDFRAAMAEANGFCFTQFERWYFQAGTPVVSVVHTNFDSAKKTFEFKLTQHTGPTPRQPTKLPFDIPVVTGLLGRESKREIAKSQIFHLRKEEETFVIHGVEEEPFLSILRNFSAPVKLLYELSDDDLAFQMAFDTDPFNRWDAGQRLTKRIILSRANDIRDGKAGGHPYAPPPLAAVVIQALRNVLNDSKCDDGFKALALVLPREAIIANDMKPCDPVAIHLSREGLRLQLRTALHEDIKRTYDELTSALDSRPYAVLPAKNNVAPRQLRNVMLGYLTCDRSAEALQLASRHFANAKNMTDKVSALACLVNTKSPEREAALQKFYDEYQDDELVLDKWFSLQAGADLPEMLEEVQLLRNHPKFTLKTPSRLRAVIMRYALNSPHFHRKDGLGYKFLADAIMEVDTFNGSIAARLANYLIDWELYDESRQQLMRTQLKRLMDVATLKPETYEIVKKGLKQ